MTFLFYPVALILLDNGSPRKGWRFGEGLTKIAASLAANRRKWVFSISIAIIILSIIGISRLKVENSFINYFKKTTEIYQGMKLIDEKLSGTTPFDVIIDLEAGKTEKSEASSRSIENDAGMFDEFEEFSSPGDEDK